MKFSTLILFASLIYVHSAYAGDTFSEKEFPLTDFSKHTVALEEIYSGGPPRDGIVAIDHPTFISNNKAKDVLAPREPVVMVKIDGEAKAYPLRILLYHEIVNDEVGGTPIFVTHCPLCNTAIVFKRKVNNIVLDFGTTGRVRDSNLIMYDRQTESWWQQFTGDSIIGKLAGTQLELISSQIVSFAQFNESYPNGLILSQDTGYRRYYGKTPYPGYDNLSGIPFLFKREIDFRLPPLERVLAISNEKQSVIFPFSYLSNKPLINTKFEGQAILVVSQASMVSTMDKKEIKNSNSMLTAAAFERTIDDEVLTFELRDNQIYDTQTSSLWNIFGEAIAGVLQGKKLKQIDNNVHFAFAWLAFYPEAKIIN